MAEVDHVWLLAINYELDWRGECSSTLNTPLNQAYEEVVHWRHNMFLQVQLGRLLLLNWHVCIRLMLMV